VGDGGKSVEKPSRRTVAVSSCAAVDRAWEANAAGLESGARRSRSGECDQERAGQPGGGPRCDWGGSAGVPSGTASGMVAANVFWRSKTPVGLRVSDAVELVDEGAGDGCGTARLFRRTTGSGANTMARRFQGRALRVNGTAAKWLRSSAGYSVVSRGPLEIGRRDCEQTPARVQGVPAYCRRRLTCRHAPRAPQAAASAVYGIEGSRRQRSQEAAKERTVTTRRGIRTRVSSSAGRTGHGIRQGPNAVRRSNDRMVERRSVSERARVRGRTAGIDVGAN